MALRLAEFSELCATCKSRTERSCPRCGTPLCEDHLPAESELRCDQCEQAYLERLGRRPGILWRHGAVALGVLTAPAIVFALVLGGTVAGSVGAFFGGVAALAAVFGIEKLVTVARARRTRRLFLAESPRDVLDEVERRALPAPTSAVADDADD